MEGFIISTTLHYTILFIIPLHCCFLDSILVLHSVSDKVRLIFLKCHRDNLSFCNLKIHSLTKFSSPEDNIILTVTKNKFIVWNNCFSNPTTICLFEFSNFNNKIKCQICLKLTIEVPDTVLVSLLLTFDIFDILF